MDFSPKVRLFPKFFCSCQAFLQKRYGNLIRAWRQALSQTDSMVSRTGFVRCVGWFSVDRCVQSCNGQRIPLLTWGVVKASFPQGPEGTFWPCFLETHRMIWVFFCWSIKKCWFYHRPKHVSHYRQLRAWALQRSPRSFGKPWTKMTAVRMLSWCCVRVKADIMILQSSLISVQFSGEVFVHLHHDIYEFISRKPVGGGNDISPAQSHPEVKRRSTSWTLEMQRFSRSSRWPLKEFRAESNGQGCMMFFVTQNVGKKCFCQQVWVTQRFGGVRAAFEVSGYPELIKMLGLVTWRRLWDGRVMSQITILPAFDFRDDGEMMSLVLIIINLSTCPHVLPRQRNWKHHQLDEMHPKSGATSSVTVCYWLKRMYRRIAANSLYSRELQLRALLLFLQGDRFRFDPLHHQCRVFSGHDEVWVHETQQAATWICWLD